jgi:hypothetical protein
VTPDPAADRAAVRVRLRRLISRWLREHDGDVTDAPRDRHEVAVRMRAIMRGEPPPQPSRTPWEIRFERRLLGWSLDVSSGQPEKGGRR